MERVFSRQELKQNETANGRRRTQGQLSLVGVCGRLEQRRDEVNDELQSRRYAVKKKSERRNAGGRNGGKKEQRGKGSGERKEVVYVRRSASRGNFYLPIHRPKGELIERTFDYAIACRRRR